MTGEEMERAIEFLLNNQARNEARMSEGFEATNRQIAETNRQLAENDRRLAENDRRLAETSQILDSLADTQNSFMRVVTETFAAQNRINEDMRLGMEQLRLAQEAAWAAIHRLSGRQDRTEAIIERLAETVRSRIEGGDENSRG